MTDLEATPIDGRVARRQRNIDAVLDVVLQLFDEEAMFPTIEQAATRSGLSLRSLYRYFADPAELLEAAIARSRELNADLSHLHAIGEGPLEQRIDDLIDVRLRVYEASGARFRATVANAARHERIRAELELNRAGQLEQFERQFAPEIRARKGLERKALVHAGDLLTQIDAIEVLRRHRNLSENEVRAVLSSSLTALFA